MEKTNIRDLKPRRFSSSEDPDDPLAVCALVTWFQDKEISQNNNPYIKYLLRDETSMIEAIAVGNRCIQKFQKEITVNNVYWFTDFQLAHVDERYRNVGHKYSIYLNDTTEVKLVTHSKLHPREVFLSTDYLHKHNLSFPENRYIDVVGKILYLVSAAVERTVMLGCEDGTNGLPLTFYKDHAKMDYNPGDYILLRQALFRRSKGTVWLSTVYRSYIERITHKHFMTITKTTPSSSPSDRGNEVEGNVETIYEETTDANLAGLPTSPAMVKLYLDALESGIEETNTIRVMVVGHKGAGKTTLVRKLLKLPVSTESHDSTDGIDVHVHKCIALDDGTWIERTESDKEEMCRRMASNVSSSLGSGHGTMDVDSISPGNSHETFKSFSNKNCNNNHNNNKEMEVSSLQSNDQQNISTPETVTIPKCSISVDLCEFQKAVTQSRSEDGKNVNVWDFAGQFIFYATHQLFLSPRAIYLLVIDLTKGLNDEIHAEQGTSLKKVSDFCEFWMHSIDTFAGNTNGSPKVLLVGTRSDQLKQSNLALETCDSLFEDIKNHVDFDPCIVKHLHNKPFITGLGDHSTRSADFLDETDDLRRSIVDISKTETWSTQLVPKRWIPLEKKLMKISADNVKHLTLAKVCELDAVSDKPIHNKEEIKVFLSYHHQLGTLVYFNEDGLSEIVVLDPKWIIDAFTTIITTTHFFEKKSQKKLNVVWQKVIKTAKISEKDLVDKVWRNYSQQDFFENKDMLLQFMQRLHMIAKIQKFDSLTNTIITEDEFNFIIPSFLANRRCNISDLNHVLELPGGSYILAFYFENSHVSPTIYHHLVATAIGIWEPYERKGNHLIYDKIAIFKLDETHFGIIEKCNLSLNISVKFNGRKLCPKICDKLRRCTEQVLQTELSRCFVEKERPYKMKVNCSNVYDHNNENPYIDWDLLKKVENILCVACDKGHSVNYCEVMKQWFPNEPTISGYIKYLTDATKHRVVEPKHVNALAMIIHENWELLGLPLGFSKREIDKIKENAKYHPPVCILEMLEKWRRRENATFETLMVAFDSVPPLGIDCDQLQDLLDKL